MLCYGISIFIQELYLACFEFLLNWFKQSNLSFRYNNNIYNLSRKYLILLHSNKLLMNSKELNLISNCEINPSESNLRIQQLEDTIEQLRHEISRLTFKNKLESAPVESHAYKYYSLSTELSKCLQSSGCELSKFSSSYDQAIKALHTFTSGFTSIASSMRSRLHSSSKSILDFMHSILNELQNLRAQLTIVQNYIAVLEFNEATLRESLTKLEKKNFTTRSVSVSRIQELARTEATSNDFKFDIAPRPKPEKNELKILSQGKIFNQTKEKSDDFASKFNKLILRNCKLKNLKQRAEIDNERLLLQLKQAKEQIAISEEEAAGRELALEIKCQKMTTILQRLKEIPTVRHLVLGFEAEMQRSKKIHNRTKSGIIFYNE